MNFHKTKIGSNSVITEQSYCCGYRTAVQMIVSGLAALPSHAGGAPDEQ